MKLFKCLLLLFAIVGWGSAPAQKRGQEAIDSLVKELSSGNYVNKEDTNKVKLLNKLSYSYYNVNPDEGIKYGFQALTLATRLNWKNGIALANSRVGILYYNKLSFTAALEYNFKALKIYEEIGDKHGIANVTGNMAGIYQMQKDYSKALECYRKALKMDVEIGEKRNIATNTGNIGSLYQLQKDYPEALEYYFKALQLYEEFGDEYGLAGISGNIGEIYCEEKNYINAMEYVQKSLEASQKLGDKFLISYNMYNVGNVYISLADDTVKQKKQANKNEILPGKFSPVASVDIPNGKSNLLARGIDYLEKGLAIGKEINSLEVIQECYEDLAIAYRLKGDYKNALLCADNYRAIKDSVFSKENNEKIVKMELKNEYELRHQADSLKTDAKEKMVEIKFEHQRTYTYFGLVAIIVLIGFSIFVVRNNRVKTHLNNTITKLVAEQEETIKQRTRELADSNEKLAHANKKLIELIQYNSHNLREPLSRVMGSMMIQEYMSSEEFYGKVWPQMQRAVADLDESIRNVVKIADETVHIYG